MAKTFSLPASKVESISKSDLQILAGKLDDSLDAFRKELTIVAFEKLRDAREYVRDLENRERSAALNAG